MKKLLFFLMLLVSLATQATVYYVSATGSDAANGLTTGTAWQTLTKVNAQTFAAGDQILFKKGDGWYGTLNPKNSGSAGNVITFGTYGTGATPTITGFTTITSGWTNEGGGVYSKVITSESQTNMVTIDGVQYGMGRYPNTTFLTYESAVSNTSITDNQLTGTPNWTGAEALIVKNGYRIERCVITGHSSGTLSYSIYSGLNTSANSTGNYFIQNDLRTLDSYGEWYHDYAGTGKFYMYFGAVDPTTKTVKVATLNNLCKVNTTKTYITLDGLALSGSIKEAFIAEYNCHYLTIQNSNISFAGSDGIYIDGQYATINNTTFNFCNRISLMTKGVNSTVTNNSISNNAVVLGQGNYGYSGISAMILLNSNATVTGNSIQNTATNGIFLSADVDAGSIKNNYIYNTCIHNWDHGSIYTYGDHTDLVIEGNVIVKTDGAGIYLDEISSFNTVKNNSVAECAEVGIKLHKAHDCIVTGNLTYDNTIGVLFLNYNTANNIYNITFTSNTIVSKLASQKLLNYSTLYASHLSTWATNTFNSNVYARPIDDNLTFFYNQIGNGNLTLAQWKSNTGVDANSTGSPKSISSESDIEFRYNATASPVQISFSWSGIDMNGTQYASNPTLQPYSSLVLIKNVTNPSGTLKPAGTGTERWGENGIMWGFE